MKTNPTEAQDAREDKISPARFRAMKEESLRDFEVQHREDIATAPIDVRTAFDETWKRVIGQAYFQAVTTRVDPNERIDPKSQDYKGFWEVLFSPKGKRDDPEDVKLSWNGQCLQIKRGAPVILPGPFLEVADHGVYPHYRQVPGEERKITSYVKHFPYTVLRKATEKEYRENKAAGDQMVKDARTKAEHA